MAGKLFTRISKLSNFISNFVAKENSGNADRETNEIVTELDEEARKKLKVIQTLLEPCERATYGQRLKDAAEKLGNHRINDEMQKFILMSLLRDYSLRKKSRELLLLFSFSLQLPSIINSWIPLTEISLNYCESLPFNSVTLTGLVLEI